MTTALTYPTSLMPQPFASGSGVNFGGKNAINAATNSPYASLNDGFPLITMQPASSGGVPPVGPDFNGILNWITQYTTWIGGGGQFAFNSALVTATGGYPVGATLQLNSGYGCVVNTSALNTQDPNAAMTGWWGTASIMVPGSVVTSATTITPTGEIFQVSGTTTVQTINLPFTGFAGQVVIIPTGVFATNTSGNIGLATAATVVGKALIMTYLPSVSKWYPSY